MAHGSAMMTAQYQANPMEIIANTNVKMDNNNATPLLGRLDSAMEAASPCDNPIIQKASAAIANSIFMLYRLLLCVGRNFWSPCRSLNGGYKNEAWACMFHIVLEGRRKNPNIECKTAHARTREAAIQP